MKTIITLSLLMCVHIIFSQAPSIPEAMVSPSTISSLVYSENSKVIESVPVTPLKTREISIAALPPVTESLTPLAIEFGMTGSFTFKRDKDLQVYDGRDVYIEDMLTGKVFDLKNAESYTFNVNRRVPDRFVMHIDNMISKYAISSNQK